MITLVVEVTDDVETLKLPVDEPAGMVSVTGTPATEEFALLRLTIAPPLGAAALRTTVPRAVFPPTTDVGLTPTDDRVAAGGGGGGGGGESARAVNRRDDENGPATPAELIALTRQKNR
jgi:hypothetical protein